eukprot:504688-Rhodomonas_salina.2
MHCSPRFLDPRNGGGRRSGAVPAHAWSRVKGLGFTVEVLECGVWGLGPRDLGSRAKDLRTQGSSIQGLGSRVWDLGSRVQGLGLGSDRWYRSRPRQSRPPGRSALLTRCPRLKHPHSHVSARHGAAAPL